MVKSLSLRIWQAEDNFLVYLCSTVPGDPCYDIVKGVQKLIRWLDSSEAEQLLYHSVLLQCKTPYTGSPNTPELHAVRVTITLMKQTQKVSSGFCTLVDSHSASPNGDFLAQKVPCLPEPKNAGLAVVSGT